MPTNNLLELRGLPVHLEAEKLTLAAILMDAEWRAQAVGVIRTEDFSLTRHKRIFQAVKDLAEVNAEVDHVTVYHRLRQAGEADADSLGYLVELNNGMPTVAHPEAYGRIVRDKAALRRLILACNHTMNRAAADEESPADVLASHQKALRDLEFQEHGDWVTPAEVMERFPGGINAFLSPPKNGQGIPTPWSKITEDLAGLQAGDLVLLAGRPSMGKAQPLGSLVLTNSGQWIRMGDIKVGDCLASPDGTDSVVQAIHPQGLIDVYRVDFWDGRSAECSEEHLWEVCHREWECPKIWSTKELSSRLKSKRYFRRLHLNLISGEFGKRSKVLPIDPYVLGVLIGDGSLSHGCGYSKPDEEMAEIVNSRLPLGYTLSRIKNSDQRNIIRDEACQDKTNRVIDALRDLKLAGTRSYEKFVPTEYLHASRVDRLDVLRGLLDTDGHVQKKTGSVEFSTTSRQLALDVQQLVWSLGGMAKIRQHKTSYTKSDGSKVQCRGAFRLNIWHRNAKEFFFLSRKRDNLAAKKNERAMLLTIKSVTHVGKKVCQCITVSHPKGLYITNDYIVTHNSVVAMQLAYHAAQRGYGAAVISLEMSKESLVQRMLSAIGNVDHHRLRTGYLNREERSRLPQAVSQIAELPLWIDDTRARTVPAVVAAIRKQAAKKPVHLLVIDHLQLMKGTKADSRNLELGEILHSMKILAGDMKICVCVLSQLNRQCEIENRQPQLSDLKETGTSEEDADVVWFVHRPERYAKNANREDLRGYAEFIIGKQRNGVVGKRKMVFLGQYQRFEEMAGELE